MSIFMAFIDLVLALFDTCPPGAQNCILAALFIIAMIVLQLSANKSERAFWKEYNRLPNPPEHCLVDREPSFEAWCFTALIAIVISLLLMHMSWR